MYSTQRLMCYEISSLRVIQLMLVVTVLMPLSNPSFSSVSETGSTGNNQQSYVLGIFPYLSPKELEKIYAPIAADYSKTLNTSVRLAISSTDKTFLTDLAKQQYDIVFVRPFDYIEIADQHGYQPLATSSKSLTAILVTQADGNFKSTNNLLGKTIVLPSPVSAVSYQINSYLLEHGINPQLDVTIRHVRSHDSCIQKVLLKIADVCGTTTSALQLFQRKIATNIQIIGKTKGIPNSIFAIHPRVPIAVRNKLIDQIASWANTSNGKRILKAAKIERYLPVQDSDYDVVRKLAKQYPIHN